MICPKCRTFTGLLAFLKKQGISMETIQAMAKNDRQRFVPSSSTKAAYYDSALSIGYNVTISQPSLVAFMIDELQLDAINHVLELGTGSAWNAAIISTLLPFGSLITVERVAALGKQAKELLASKKNTNVLIGDAVNMEYKHKFDRIVVTAEFMNEKQIKNFVKRNAGYFCIAIYPYDGILWRMTKCGSNITLKRLKSVRFVPVIEG